MKISMSKTITLVNNEVVTSENARDYVSFIGGIMAPNMSSSEPICSGGGLSGGAAKHDLLLEALNEAGYSEDDMTTVMSVEDLISALADYNPKAFETIVSDRQTNYRLQPSANFNTRSSEDVIADMAEFN